MVETDSIQKFLEDHNIPFKMEENELGNVKFIYSLTDEQKKAFLKLGKYEEFDLKETTTKQQYELKILLPKPHVNADGKISWRIERL